MKRVLLLFCFVFRAHTIYLNNTRESDAKNEDNPAFWTEEGVWGPLMEEYALTNHREKRVMQIPLSDNYNSPNKSTTTSEFTVVRESKISGGKIQNKPPSISRPKDPQRPVTETDLYLLGAMEKLVYRLDFMEKRLRRVEEMLYYAMAGNRIDQDPCPKNFTRAGTNCYYFSSNAGRELDWKAASKTCKNMGATLAEMETIEENQDIIAFIQSNGHLRGKDFWTGGLNPGLLWIWSNSARPVPTKDGNNNKKKPGSEILGEGRCLRLSYDPSLRSYKYKGTDCGIRYSFICEIPENSSSNEIKRIGRSKNIISN